MLFYVNIGAFQITDGTLPDLAKLVEQGWRSVSFVDNNSMCCVLHAGRDAPSFLRQVQGRRLQIAEKP